MHHAEISLQCLQLLQGCIAAQAPLSREVDFPK